MSSGNVHPGGSGRSAQKALQRKKTLVFNFKVFCVSYWFSSYHYGIICVIYLLHSNQNQKQKIICLFKHLKEGILLLLLSHFSHVRFCVTPQTAAHEAPPSLGFSRPEHWSGLPFPSPMHESVYLDLNLSGRCSQFKFSYGNGFQVKFDSLELVIFKTPSVICNFYKLLVSIVQLIKLLFLIFFLYSYLKGNITTEKHKEILCFCQ